MEKNEPNDKAAPLILDDNTVSHKPPELPELGVIRREKIDEYMDSLSLRKEAERILEDAEEACIRIKKDAYQEGFNQGIQDSAAEVSTQLLQLQDVYSEKADELAEIIPEIVAEISYHLIKLEDKNNPGYDLFRAQLNKLVLSTITDHLNQDGLLLRVSPEFKNEIKQLAITTFGKDWIERNLQIRADPTYRGFHYSFEHAQGVYNLNGKQQLLEILTRVFPNDADDDDDTEEVYDDDMEFEDENDENDDEDEDEELCEKQTHSEHSEEHTL